jgi:segregation and condensation protein B
MEEEKEQAPGTGDQGPEGSPNPSADLAYQSATPDPGSQSADITGIVEAVLFAADAPVGVERLVQVAGAAPEAIQAAVIELNRQYSASGRTFRINRVAQGFQLYTMPEYAEWVRRLYQHQYVHRLSRAAPEVLAIVAYRQPMTRPEIEKLRNVDCSGPLLTLLERRLIATAGRAHRPGNPFLYRTTREFLRYFGLERLEDLPRIEELGDFLASHQPGGESEPRTFETLAVDFREAGDSGPGPRDQGTEGSGAEPGTPEYPVPGPEPQNP